MPLFNHNLVYACDEFGPYIELEGSITEVGELLGDGAIGVTVKTDRGQFRAYACKHMASFAAEAKWACVRVYDAGGGWYPDNRIMSLSDEAS